MNSLLDFTDSSDDRVNSVQLISLADVVSMVASRKPRRTLAVRNPNEARNRLEAMMRADREALTGVGHRLAGVDEAGRGPLAGPVVAAAVVLPADSDEHLVSCLLGIDDSKRLSPRRRESLFLAITESADEVSLGIATSEEIDQANILRATHMAMQRAVAGLASAPELALVDGNSDPGFTCCTRCVVKGDAQMLSVSAASIVAKVVRDAIMESIHRFYPQYGFDSHKGYPTRAHYQALEEYGPSLVHRRTFRLSIWT